MIQLNPRYSDVPSYSFPLTNIDLNYNEFGNRKKEERFLLNKSFRINKKKIRNILFRIDAPKRSRTPNLLIRSQTLYPVELWAHICNAEDRNRTGTVITHRRILSPVRLPVPPPRRIALAKRKTGFEPATPTLARWCSTTELFPRGYDAG